MRKRLSTSASRRIVRRSATRRINVVPPISRGGIRL